MAFAFFAPFIVDLRLIFFFTDDLTTLGTVLESAQRHIHSATHLFRLAQEALKNATRLGPAGVNPTTTVTPGAPTVTSQPLLNAAFQLGLQVQ